jgi:non-heme chloroperoxidase
VTIDTRPLTIASSMKAARLIKGARDVYYPGAPHGITATHPDQINAELLASLRS